MTMNKRLPKATVCAGIIFHNGKILIGKRSYGLTTADLWEFPGGKIEAGETPEQCLIRECMEELGIGITVGEEFDRAFYAYPDRDLDFIFLLAKTESKDDLIHQDGFIHPAHTELKWVDPCELADYEFCPADKDVIQKLIKTFA